MNPLGHGPNPFWENGDKGAWPSNGPNGKTKKMVGWHFFRIRNTVAP